MQKDDVIYRADVVSEIHKYFWEEIEKTSHGTDEDGEDVYTDMPTVNSLLAHNKQLSKRIKALPSAHPELDEWCTDCKEYDKEKHSCPRWNRVIRNTLKDIQPERLKGKWIHYDEGDFDYDYKCSNCSYAVWDDSDFCPGCGAYMRENGE